MTTHSNQLSTTCPTTLSVQGLTSRWTQRYGERHRMTRIHEFPTGIIAPSRVRIYERADHFVLQWWNPAEKRTLNERVDGDLVEAIARARKIDERLEHFRSSGAGPLKVEHDVLVQRFLADLNCRANAGEIDPRTVQRYESALKHYQAFVEQPNISRQFAHIGSINRQFALQFMAYLSTLQVHVNGHAHGPTQRMGRPDYVVDVVRSLFEWAADPQRGNLVPEGFHNPFRRRSRHGTSSIARVSLGEPDITLEMAVEFIEACDNYQLLLFAPMALYGLRAAEPCFLFREHLHDDWLDVPCLPDLGYYTKGRREKRLPLLPCLNNLFRSAVASNSEGLLYRRREVIANAKHTPLIGMKLTELAAEFQRRGAAPGICTAADRRRVRDRLLHDAGGINYGHIAGEFGKLARTLKWPRCATLKDFRHLTATCLENSGMPEHYRKFLLGQSPGRAAIITYTHLNQIRERFDEAAVTLRPLVEAIERRTRELDIFSVSEGAKHEAEAQERYA